MKNIAMAGIFPMARVSSDTGRGGIAPKPPVEVEIGPMKVIM